MHMPRRGIPVFSRVDEDSLPAHASEAAEGTQARRTTAHDDGIVDLIALGPRSVSSSREDCCLCQAQEAQAGEEGAEEHGELW